MDDLKSKSFRALNWDLFERFSKHGIRFIISIFLARLLEPEEFGLVGMVTVFTSLSNSFIDFGFGNALIHKKDPNEVQYSTIFYINFAVGGLLTFLMFISAEYIGAFYGNPTVSSIAKAISITFLINAINIVQRAQITKSLEFYLFTRANLTALILSGIIGITMAFTGFGVWSLVAQTIASGIITTAVIWYDSDWRPKLLFSLREIKDLWDYGQKELANGLISAFFNKADVIIIGKALSASILGFYFRAKSMEDMVVEYSSKSLMKVFFPVISTIQDDKKRVVRIFKKSLSIIGLITFGLLGLLYVTAEDLIVVLFSDKWLPSVRMYQILILGGYGYPINSLLVNVFKGLGYPGLNLKLGIFRKSLKGVCFVIAWFYGIYPFLWAWITISAISTQLNMYYVKKLIGVSVWQHYKIILPYFFGALGSALLVYQTIGYLDIARIFTLALSGLVYLALYLSYNKLIDSKALNLILKSDQFKKVSKRVKGFFRKRG